MSAKLKFLLWYSTKTTGESITKYIYKIGVYIAQICKYLILPLTCKEESIYILHKDTYILNMDY